MARHVLVLVEAERALHAVDVVVAAAIVVLIVEVDARDEAVRAIEPEAVVAVAEAAADELALEVDDALIQRRQEVAEIAPRVIVARRDRASLAGRCRVDEAEPRLLERFAGIELNVQRCRGARVDRRHGRREAARVVGHGLIGEVDDRQEIAVLAEIEIEPAREELVLVRALCPIAVDLLIGQAHEVVQPLGLAAGLDLRLLEPVAAGRHANLRVGLSAARLRRSG